MSLAVVAAMVLLVAPAGAVADQVAGPDSVGPAQRSLAELRVGKFVTIACGGSSADVTRRSGAGDVIVVDRPGPDPLPAEGSCLAGELSMGVALGFVNRMGSVHFGMAVEISPRSGVDAGFGQLGVNVMVGIPIGHSAVVFGEVGLSFVVAEPVHFLAQARLGVEFELSPHVSVVTIAGVILGQDHPRPAFQLGINFILPH